MYRAHERVGANNLSWIDLDLDFCLLIAVSRKSDAWKRKEKVVVR